MEEFEQSDRDQQSADLDTHLKVPDRQVYTWGWATASAIVRARYADSAIDALPVIHPDHGWDRFLLTRRVTDKVFEG